MDMVDLAPEYVVKMKNEFFSADYLGNEFMHPLQTLTEYTPTYADTLEVPEYIQAVDAAQIPEMNLENLTSFAKISTSDAILNDFTDRYETDLEGIQLQADGSDAIYTVQNHIVADTDGNLRYVLESAPKLLRLPENVERIGEQAFANAVTADILIDEDTEELVFAKDCLEGSNVKVIWCHTEAQKQMLEDQLKQAGISGVEARIVSEQKVTTKQGYVYTVREPEGTAELLAAPMPSTGRS